MMRAWCELWHEIWSKVIQAVHYIEGPHRSRHATRGIVRTTRRKGGRRCEHVCLHFYTKALAAELPWCVCVYVSMCQVCASCKEDGKLERRREAETVAAERKGAGVNTNHDDPDGVGVCVRFRGGQSLTSSSPEDAGAQRG